MHFAPFQLMLQDDVPEVWKDAERRANEMSKDHHRALMKLPEGSDVKAELVLDMPNLPIFHDYLGWLRMQPDAAFRHGVMISAIEKWKERKAELNATVASMIHEGKPALVMAIVWHPRQPEP